jgi:hypothetical protein
LPWKRFHQVERSPCIFGFPALKQKTPNRVPVSCLVDSHQHREQKGMTENKAQSLARWIKDHDTRFIAKATQNDGSEESKEGWRVTLTDPDTNQEQEPVLDLSEYQTRYVDAPTCGPTIREKWERFVHSLGA